MAKLAAARPCGAPQYGASIAARVRPVARGAVLPGSIILVALLLRVINLELQAWTPDTYEQMSAARRLVAGEFPFSVGYPPGVAITVAPAFVFLPQTLATQQGVVIASALVLVVAGYAGARSATRDHVAPILLAVGLAATPQIVYFSRDGFFDVMNTAWIVATILLVPWLRGRSLPTFAAYGVLLAVAVNIRATNPAFLPAALIYWADVGRIGFGPRAVWRATYCREVACAGGALIGAFAFFAYLGGGLGPAASHAPLTFEYAGRNTVFFAVAQLGDRVSAIPMLGLAAAGSFFLWRHNRTLLFVSLYMTAIFPLAHVPLPFANNRYMLPSMAFVLLLAAHAPAAVMELTARQTAITRNAWRALAAALVLLLGCYFVAVDGAMIAGWPARAARSDEAAYRQIRPSIAGLPAGSLLVSGGTRGVRDSNSRIEYLDLIDYSAATDNGPARVDEVMLHMQRALGDGRRVYYLYTSVEGINITFTQSGPGYQPYFDAADERFRLTTVYDTSVRYFALYRVEPR